MGTDTSADPCRLPGEAVLPDAAAAIAALEQGGGYVVLRRFAPVSTYNPDDGGPKKVAMFIDTETTGTDYKRDAVFEIGYVLAEYNRDTAKLYRVLDAHSSLNDPGFPLPENIEKLTGHSYKDVQGRVFDSEKIRADINRADVIIAQGAGFDRHFLEPIFPELATKPWACALDDGPWEEMGINTRNQEFLAFRIAKVFYKAHQALVDAQVMLHILAQPSHNDKSIFHNVLHSARKTTYRLWAVGAPFEKREDLKARGYRWSPETDPDAGTLKSWYAERVTDLETELAWLGENIYTSNARVTVDTLSAFERYSTRFADRSALVCEATKRAPSP